MMVPHAVESSQGVKHREVPVMAGGTMSLLIAIVCNLFGAGLLQSATRPSSWARQLMPFPLPNGTIRRGVRHSGHRDVLA